MHTKIYTTDYVAPPKKFVHIARDYSTDVLLCHRDIFSLSYYNPVREWWDSLDIYMQYPDSYDWCPECVANIPDLDIINKVIL